MHDPNSPKELESLWDFLATIDWMDPLFLYLGIFHGVCYTVTALLRNQTTALSAYFCCLLACVLGAEKLNEWSAQNWQKISRQQYFDSNGMFISVVFSLPILLNCLGIVIFWLSVTGKLLIDVKKKQLRTQQKSSAKGDNSTESTSQATKETNSSQSTDDSIRNESNTHTDTKKDK